MTPLQPALHAHPYRNQWLFSDHYLDTILPEQAQWKQGAQSVFEWLAKIQCIYDAFTPSTNEAQTEHDLIRPILALLGHDFEVQPALRTSDGAKCPPSAGIGVSRCRYPYDSPHGAVRPAIPVILF